MIITRDNAQGYWQLLFVEKDVVRVEVDVSNLYVWFEWSDKAWPIHEFKENSSMRLWLTACWESMLIVCVEHKRFIPCRRAREGSVCRESLDYDDVETVRLYHEAVE